MLRSLSTALSSLVSRASAPSAGAFSAVKQSSLVLSRCSSVFTRNLYDSDRLWIGVTGAPGQKKKRSRGKRRVTRPRIDLNRGQQLGVNTQGLVIPVLQGRLTDSKGLLKRPEPGQFDMEKYNERILEMRNKQGKKRGRLKQPPLLRGWSGGQMGGQRIEPPQPVLDYAFDGFESRIVEFRMVSHMTATFGRYPSFSVMVVTGNRRGLGGYAVSKSPNRQAALRKANSRAGQRLEFFDLRDGGRTLWHPGYAKHLATSVVALPKEPGYGLRCHRLIKEVCRVIGIEDLYAKVEGSVNYKAIMRAFFRILRQQESFQHLADRERLHVVEFVGDRPRVLASPSDGQVRGADSGSEDASDDVDSDGAERLRDLATYYMGGRLLQLKRRSPPAYLKGPGQTKRRRERAKFRNQLAAFRERCMLTDLRPEVAQPPPKYQPGMLGLRQSFYVGKEAESAAA
uniref:Small ribosomal subunit protein uS5m n=3 Tax=Macrostomum lignano TaxID=282301 RepID=A0A1I8FVL6_9PLAT